MQLQSVETLVFGESLYVGSLLNLPLDCDPFSAFVLDVVLIQNRWPVCFLCWKLPRGRLGIWGSCFGQHPADLMCDCSACSAVKLYKGFGLGVADVSKGFA